MSTSKDAAPSSSWAATIQSVRTPLGFFALVLLVIVATLSIVVASVQEPAKTWSVAALIGLITLLIVVVGILAFVRPEALHGRRPKAAVTSEETKASLSESVHSVAEASGTQPELIDPSLVHFIPPLPPARFKTIDLPRHEPTRYYQSPYAPTGQIMIYDTPFSLLPVNDTTGKPMGHVAVDLHPTPQNVPDSEVIQVNESNVCAIHFLLAAGHGWRQRNGVTLLHRRIGYIRLRFSDGTDQTASLVLGKNIREWAFGNDPNLVTEIDTSQAQPAWVSHDNARRIDLLSIRVEGGPKRVNTVEIVARFGEDNPEKEVVLPAILVSAITLERRV